MGIFRTLSRAIKRLADKKKTSAETATLKSQPIDPSHIGTRATVAVQRPVGVTMPDGVEKQRRRGPAATAVELSRAERRRLRAPLRRERTTLAVAERIKVVLALDREPHSCVSAVADEMEHDAKFVRRWRDRFLDDGLTGLKTRSRTGCPSTIGALSRCQVIAMACGKPKEFGVPYQSKWTTDSLLAAYREKQQLSPELDPMSRSSVLRILNGAEIRPHRIKMWLHSPDPLFREKVSDVCGIYLNPPVGSHVLCVDEKTGMQALGRKHPGRNAKPGQDARMDYEYIRNGTRKLIACWDTQTGHVYGEVRPHRKAVDLIEFMEALALRYPTGEVHIIWDNLNIHHDGPSQRWTQFNLRHGGRFHFHYTPIHASWVNQIELWFGILQRRVLRYGVFNSLEELDETVTGFIDHWNANERKPFRWSFKGYPLQTGRKAA